MENSQKKSILSVRFSQAIMIFLAVVTAFTMRINISVGIVAMTSNTTRTDFPIIPWDTQTKTIILSSYFWGYVLLQLPAGLFAQKYGPKPLMFLGMMGCGIITLFTPVIANNMSWRFTLVSRVLQGVGQGILFPSLYALISKWAPPSERNRFLACAFSGAQVGTVVTLFGAGLLAAGPGGWPSIFYVSGSCGILWALLWAYIGANSPAEHPFISQEERNMIESSLEHSSSDSKNMKIPWKKICTSGPMWALLTTHFCQNWGFWTFLVLMPSYLGSALHVDIKNNGLLSSLPYLLMFAFTMGFSKVADIIIEKKFMSISMAKKMWNSIGMWGAAAGVIGLTMINSTTLAIALLIISISLNFGVFFGLFTNHLDLSPNFASVLMGLTNCISNSASFLAPLTAGVILKDETSIDQWNTVYYISALFFILGNLVFIVFGTSNLQAWNGPKKTPEDKSAEIPLKTIYEEKIVTNNTEEVQ